MSNIAQEIVRALRSQILSEGRVEKTQVGMLVLYPTGYQFFNQKRFAPIAPEESAQQADKLADAWAKKLHIVLTDPQIGKIRAQRTRAGQEQIQAQVNDYIENIDWEAIKIGSELYGTGLTRGALLELVEKLNLRRIPPNIKQIADKYNTELTTRWEEIIDRYQGLDKMEQDIEQAREAMDRVGGDEDEKAAIIDPRRLAAMEAEFLEKRGQYSDEVSALQKEIYGQPLNDEELGLVRDEYWDLLRRVGQMRAKKSVEYVKFKEVGARVEDVYQVASTTLQSLYSKWRGKVMVYLIRQVLEFSTAPVVGTAQLDAYTAHILQRPENRQMLARIVAEYEQTYPNADEVPLNDEDLLRVIRAGFGRKELYQNLLMYNVPVNLKDAKHIETIEDAVEAAVDELAMAYAPPSELDDQAAEQAAELELQKRLQTDIASTQYDDEEEEDEDEEPPEELFEAEEKYQYIPLPEKGSETWRPPVDLTRAGRQAGDIRPPLSDHKMFGPGKGNVLLLMGYEQPEKGRWLGFESVGGRGQSRRLSGRNDPFHAILEWLWVSLLSAKKPVEPYDGFLRNKLPEGQTTDTYPDELWVRGYSPEQGYDQRYGSPPMQQTSPKQIPIPVPINYQSISYHLAFRIGTSNKDSFGGTPAVVRENFLEFLQRYGSVLTNKKIQFEVKEVSEDADFPYTIVYFYANRDNLTVAPTPQAAGEDETPVASDEMRKRIRLARSINSTKIENIANRIKINPRAYTYKEPNGKSKTYEPIALWYAIGGGKIGLSNDTKRYHLEELVNPNQMAMLNKRVEQSSLAQRQAVVRPDDYQFPLALIRLTIQDLQNIYWKQENPRYRTAIQNEIDALEEVLSHASQSDTQRKHGYRVRRANKAAEAAAALESKKAEKARERDFQAVENQVIAARTWGGGKLDESVLTGYEIFRMVRAILQTCGNLLQRDVWDDTYKYRSLVQNKKVFENLLAIALDPEFSDIDAGEGGDKFREMVRDTITRIVGIELMDTSVGEEGMDPIIQALRGADLGTLLDYRKNLDGSLWVHPDEYNIKMDAMIALYHIIKRIHDGLEHLIEENDPKISPIPKMFARSLFAYKNIGGE
jgi:hypothetical protein